MRLTNDTTQKKTLTLNKKIVSQFNSSDLKKNNSVKLNDSGNNTTSITCVTSITI